MVYKVTATLQRNNLLFQRDHYDIKGMFTLSASVNFLINQVSYSKNTCKTKPQLIRYDADIDAVATNHSLTLSVNRP